MKKILALILALVMILSLAACGKDGGDNPGGNSGDYLKDNITVALSGDGGTLDPFASFVNWGSASMTGLIFQGLIQTDYDYNVYYEMAKEITQIDDTHWQIVIWDCIYDTAGNQITIDDVIWGYQQCIDSGNKGAIAKFESIEKADDDYTAIMTLNAPFGAGDFEKHFGNVKVLSRKTYEEVANGDMTNNPIGTGPYKLADPANDYVIGSSVLLTVNEDYWGYNIDGDFTDPDDPYYDPFAAQNFKTITYKVTQDASSRAIALEMGTVDIVDSLEAIDLANLDTEQFNLIDLPQRPPVAFVLNAGEDSILSDLTLRQALLYAIDDEEVANALGVPASVAYSIQPNQVDTPDAWKTERDYYNYDPDKAAELLAEAGYNGEAIKLMYVESTISTAAAVTMQAQLRKLGINIDLKSYDMISAQAYKYDGTMWDLRLETLGGGAYMSQTIKAWWSQDSAQHLDGGKNISLVPDATLDALYEAVNSLDKTEEDILAWGEYFDSMAYGYGICTYSNQTACVGELQSTILTSNGAVVPNAFVLA